MNRLRFNPLYNWRLDGRHSYVLGSIKIGVCRVVAQATLKLRLAFAIGLFAMPALATRPGSIGRVNQTKRHAVTNGAVLNKTQELVERPSYVLSPLRLFRPYPLIDAAQVLELYLSGGAFSRFNEVLGNLVVPVSPKTGLSTRDFFQPAFSRAGAALLQARAVVKELLALRFNLCARKRLAIGGGRYLSEAKVNAERTCRLGGRFISKLALQMNVPTSGLLSSDELPALDRESGT